MDAEIGLVEAEDGVSAVVGHSKVDVGFPYRGEGRVVVEKEWVESHVGRLAGWEGSGVVGRAIVGQGIIVIRPRYLAGWRVELKGADIAVGKSTLGHGRVERLGWQGAC